MDAAAVMQAISTVGFPIACCLGMAWYVKYTTDKHREELERLNDQHKEEMSDVTKLCERLEPGADLHG